MTDNVKNEIQLVVFRLASEEYGISVLQVQEIKRLTEITRVPYTPDYIKGVINLRGSVTPVIDLKTRLGLPPGEVTEETRIIIIKTEEFAVGLIVDAVLEVMTVNTDNIDDAARVGEVNAQYLQGIAKVDNRLILLLDLTEIITLTGSAA